MYSTVIGAKQIAITLNNEGLLTQKGHKWTNIRILDILANPVYTDTLVWGETTLDYDGKTINSDPENIIRIENAHPAIIDRDTFDCIQKCLSTFNPMNTRIIQPRALNSNYLFKWILTLSVW
jgi:site-specific DNA recombinase